MQLKLNFVMHLIPTSGVERNGFRSFLVTTIRNLTARLGSRTTLKRDVTAVYRISCVTSYREKETKVSENRA